MENSNESVLHSAVVKEELNDYSSCIKDVALKERGYVATRLPVFIKDFESIVANADASIKRLGELTKDNEEFQLYLDTLGIVHKKIIHTSRNTVDSIPSEEDLYFTFVIQKERLDNIKRISKILMQIEDELLIEREVKKEKISLNTPKLVGSLLIFCLILLVLAFWQMSQAFRSKQRLIRKLYKHESELEDALSEINKNKDELINARTIERFKIISDLMPQFVWTANPDGALDFFSQSVFNYSGLTKEEIMRDGWLQIVHPDDREANITKWEEAVNTGQPFHLEHRFKKSDGTYRWQLSRAVRVNNENGKVQMWVGTSTDIHENILFQAELERQVEERTKLLKEVNIDLEKSNTELAQFAFVASHDLQEPLRKIQTFSTMILDREAANLSESGKEFFKRIRESSSRMKQLITDILVFSKTGNMEEVSNDVDVDLLVREIANPSLLNDEIKLVDITSKLPVIKGVYFQIHQIFSNLINNAIKFNKANNELIITISSKKIIGKESGIKNAVPEKWYYVIEFSDNGIGFENQHKVKMFQVFQQLHPKEKYQGTGIGLALVKKIIEQHQGFIDARGELNVGATFYLYFPVEPNTNKS